MSDVDFEAILSKNCDDIKEPQAFPGGTYDLTISPNRTLDVSSKKKTPYVELEFVDLIPQDDVDMDLFNEAKDSRTNEPVLKNKFYLSEAAQFMLSNFFDAVGIDTNGRTILDCLEDTPGEHVFGFLEVKFSDAGRPFNELTKFVAP